MMRPGGPTSNVSHRLCLTDTGHRVVADASVGVLGRVQQVDLAAPGLARLALHRHGDGDARVPGWRCQCDTQNTAFEDGVSYGGRETRKLLPLLDRGSDTDV